MKFVVLWCESDVDMALTAEMRGAMFENEEGATQPQRSSCAVLRKLDMYHHVDQIS